MGISCTLFSGKWLISMVVAECLSLNATNLSRMWSQLYSIIQVASLIQLLSLSIAYVSSLVSGNSLVRNLMTNSQFYLWLTQYVHAAYATSRQYHNRQQTTHTECYVRGCPKCSAHYVKWGMTSWEHEIWWPQTVVLDIYTTVHYPGTRAWELLHWSLFSVTGRRSIHTAHTKKLANELLFTYQARWVSH